MAYIFAISMVETEQMPTMTPTTEANVARALKNPPEKKQEPVNNEKPAAVASTPANIEKIPATEGEKKPEAQGDAPVEQPADKAEKLAKLKEKSKGKKSETFLKGPEKLTEVPADGVVIPATIQAELDKYKKELEAKNKLLSDEDVQILLEAKKSNKDIFDVLREVEGINPDSLSPEQLHEIDCKNKGLVGEDFEEAMSDFRELKPYQQKAATADVKAKLKADVGNKKLNFLSKIKEGAAESEVENQAQIRAAQKTEQDFNALCENYVGKNHLGLTGTPQMAESMKNIIKTGELIGKNQDGSLNANDLFEFAHYKLFKEAMLEEVRNAAYADAYEEFEKEFGATDGSAKIVRTPTGTVMSEKEQFDHTMSTAKPVR